MKEKERMKQKGVKRESKGVRRNNVIKRDRKND